MPIIKDSKNIANVYKGDTSIAKIYKGESLVYQKNNIEPILELDANTLYQEESTMILRNKIEKYNYLSLEQGSQYNLNVSTDGEGGKYLFLKANLIKLNDDVTPISLTKEDFNFTYITKISCSEATYTTLFANGQYDGGKNWVIQKASSTIRLLLNNKVGAVKFQNALNSSFVISIRLEKLEDGSGKLIIYDHTNNEKLETTIDVSNIVDSDKWLLIAKNVNFYYSAFYKQVLTDEQITSEIERLDKNNKI